MDRLLKGIEDDEKSIISSRSSGSSGSRTLIEVGAAGGKSISAIREMWLQVVDSLRVRSRLRAIGSSIEKGNDYIPPVYYQELLEFQRYGSDKT